ncbi:hypothetical protein ALQ93_101907 [Pseudomonas syringae pv. pisi]|nr:hypothetical protein ALQ93_101907 [Pseudomonas syringae pv. pisi]
MPLIPRICTVMSSPMENVSPISRVSTSIFPTLALRKRGRVHGETRRFNALMANQ